MMNREQALQWLASNVKAWPWSKQVLPVIDNPDGWEWVATGGQWKQLVCLGGLITHDDWVHASKPAPASNKPNWEDAPEDANHLCQMDDGQWLWSSFKSVTPEEDGGWQGDGDGNWRYMGRDKPNPNWRDTLEHRPMFVECYVENKSTDCVMKSTPIDTRQADSIEAGEALTEAATITPEQVAAIVGDAMAAKNTNLGKLGISVLALKQIRADIEITQDKIRREEANLRALKLGATSLSTDIQEALEYFGY